MAAFQFVLPATGAPGIDHLQCPAPVFLHLHSGTRKKYNSPHGSFSRSPLLKITGRHHYQAEGKLVTEIVVPNADIAATALAVQMITQLSASKIKLGRGPLCPVASPIRQFSKLMEAPVVFLNSSHSLFGRPTWGVGSPLFHRSLHRTCSAPAYTAAPTTTEAVKAWLLSFIQTKNNAGNTG
jgi:hypothetical protein